MPPATPPTPNTPLELLHQLSRLLRGADVHAVDAGDGLAFFPARVTPTRTCCLATSIPLLAPVPDQMPPPFDGDDDPPFDADDAALRSARMDPFPTSAMASSMDMRPSPDDPSLATAARPRPARELGLVRQGAAQRAKVGEGVIPRAGLATTDGCRAFPRAPRASTGDGARIHRADDAMRASPSRVPKL